jgi:hypothetical protein
VKYHNMNLNNRVLRLERIWQNRLNLDEHDESAEHDRITGDNLLRIWEGGADDWVRERVEQVIEKCEGLSPAAQASLQERLRILQTGSPEEILLVIAGLARDAPGWSSDREANVIAEALRVDPATAQAVARFGILQVGRKDWRAFASWLERRAPRKYGPNQNPQGDHRPKVAGAKSSRWAPEESPAKVDRGLPLTATSPAATGSTGEPPP